MSGLNIMYDNFVSSSVVSITTGTENAQFPLSNILDDSPSIKFRSTGNSVVIVFDLQQTRDIDSFVLIGDSTQALAVTAASVKLSSTTDFSLATPTPLAISSQEKMAFVITTQDSKRFVELTLTGNGSFCEIGSFFVGMNTNIPQNGISIDSFSYSHRDLSTTRKNQFGQRFIDKRNKIKLLGGSIDLCTKSEQELLDDLFISVGSTLPVVIFIDTLSEGINNGKFKLTMYGYIVNQPQWSAAGGQLYNTTIQMEQAV